MLRPQIDATSALPLTSAAAGKASAFSRLARANTAVKAAAAFAPGIVLSGGTTFSLAHKGFEKGPHPSPHIPSRVIWGTFGLKVGNLRGPCWPRVPPPHLLP